MKSLFTKIFGVFMVLAAASIIAQGASKHAEKIRELTRAVRVGIAVESVIQLAKGVVELKRNELLAKVDKPELFDTSAGQYYITSLVTPLGQKLAPIIRNMLKELNLPDFIEKMPIVGIKPVKREKIVVSTCYCTIPNKDLPAIPYAMVINPEAFSIFPLRTMFFLLREMGHIKACCSNLRLDKDKELGKVVADVYALSFYAKIYAQKVGEEEVWKSIVHDFYLIDNLNPYLSPYELVYHAEKLLDDQRKGGSFDVLLYAQKIIADRKNDSYEQKIIQEAEGLLGYDGYEVAQHADKDIQIDPKLKKLVAGVKIGTAVKNVSKNLPKRVEKIMDRWRKRILSEVGKSEPLDTSAGQFYITSKNIEPILEEDIRWVLKLIDVPESIEKMPIVGMKPAERELAVVVLSCPGFNNDLPKIPFAISCNEASFGTKKEGLDKVKRLFAFFHEGGHIKASLSGVKGDEELNEVIADIYALAVMTRISDGVELINLLAYCLRNNHLHPYLSSQELIHHTAELLKDQRKVGNFDVLSYAQKIVADRKNKLNVKNGSKEFIKSKI